jgi:hypothetical protein
MPVRHDLGLGRDLPVGEALERVGVIVLGVGEAHPSACFRSLCGPPFPPTSAPSSCTQGPSGSLSECTIAVLSLCNQLHAVL